MFPPKDSTAQRADFMKIVPFRRFCGGIKIFACFAHVICHCDVDDLVNIVIFKYYIIVHV